jgi:hypothetical protein
MIIGALAKQSALVSELQLMAQNKSSQNTVKLIETFNENLKKL